MKLKERALESYRIGEQMDETAWTRMALQRQLWNLLGVQIEPADQVVVDGLTFKLNSKRELVLVNICDTCGDEWHAEVYGLFDLGIWVNDMENKWQGKDCWSCRA